MRNGKNLFKEQKNKSGTLKYFIIAFSVFIVILAVCSAFLLMRSLDFDFGNLVDSTAEEAATENTETPTDSYSVESLSGKSSIAFICTDDNGALQFSVIVSTDFDNKAMTVKTFEKSAVASYNGKTSSCANIYDEYSSNGLKTALGGGKYVKCTEKELKKILSLFDNITVNVPNRVDYHSAEFNLELEPGLQAVSADYAEKLLMLSDDYSRSLIVCDIIKSVLTPENAADSAKLFKDFVNSCETDISVIDYSNSAEKLTVYSNAEDKFMPVAVR